MKTTKVFLFDFPALTLIQIRTHNLQNLMHWRVYEHIFPGINERKNRYNTQIHYVRFNVVGIANRIRFILAPSLQTNYALVTSLFIYFLYVLFDFKIETRECVSDIFIVFYQEVIFTMNKAGTLNRYSKLCTTKSKNVYTFVKRHSVILPVL